VGAPLISVDSSGGQLGGAAGGAASYREEERAGSGNVLIGYGTRARWPATAGAGAAAGPRPDPGTASVSHAGWRAAPGEVPAVRQLARRGGWTWTPWSAPGPGWAAP